MTEWGLPPCSYTRFFIVSLFFILNEHNIYQADCFEHTVVVRTVAAAASQRKQNKESVPAQ